MRQYLDLVKHVLATGSRKENRTGVDTISTFNYNYEVDLQDGFPLLTTKKLPWKSVVIELLWFLSGSNKGEFLDRHGVKLWVPWYNPDGTVNAVYGPAWTRFDAPRKLVDVGHPEPSGDDYVKPSFPKLNVVPGHPLCGTTHTSKTYGQFLVIEHTGQDAEGRALFTVQFHATGYITRNIRADVVQRGEIRDPYVPRTHGVGYFGEPDTSLSPDFFKDLRKVWWHMLDRCYNLDCKEYPHYGLKGVRVCNRWHNFAEFLRDCHSLPGWGTKRDNPKGYALDKDHFGASVYSPTTCVWLRHTDNRLYAWQRPVTITFPDGRTETVPYAKRAARITGVRHCRVLWCVETGATWEGHTFQRADKNLRYPLPNDQIRWAVSKLKSKPMSRDIVVSAWQPHIAQQPPTANAYWAPCHVMWILNVQNEELFEHAYSVFPSDDPHWENQLGYVMASTQEEADVKAHEKFGGKGQLFASDTQSQFELAVAKSKRWNPPGSPDGWLDKPMIPDGHRQRLCLHLTQRSADVLIGVPFNIASYALLLHLLARFSGIEPGIFGHTLVDAHVYTAKPDGSQSEYDHVPGALEQLRREPRALPRLIISEDIRTLEDVERLLHPSVTTEEIMSKFILEGYDPWPAIPFRVAV